MLFLYVRLIAIIFLFECYIVELMWLCVPPQMSLRQMSLRPTCIFYANITRQCRAWHRQCRDCRRHYSPRALPPLLWQHDIAHSNDRANQMSMSEIIYWAFDVERKRRSGYSQLLINFQPKSHWLLCFALSSTIAFLKKRRGWGGYIDDAIGGDQKLRCTNGEYRLFLWCAK